MLLPILIAGKNEDAIVHAAHGLHRAFQLSHGMDMSVVKTSFDGMQPAEIIEFIDQLPLECIIITQTDIPLNRKIEQSVTFLDLYAGTLSDE